MVSVESVVSGWFLLPSCVLVMVSVASVVCWLWFLLIVLCVGYGFCCQCCVLIMVFVNSVVCWLWFLLTVLCVGYGFC